MADPISYSAGCSITAGLMNERMDQWLPALL